MEISLFSDNCVFRGHSIIKCVVGHLGDNCFELKVTAAMTQAACETVCAQYSMSRSPCVFYMFHNTGVCRLVMAHIQVKTLNYCQKPNMAISFGRCSPGNDSMKERKERKKDT